VQGGVVVHNETGKPGTAVVRLTTDSHVTGGGERSVAVAKGARVPVLFDLIRGGDRRCSAAVLGDG